jgi:hypothetical protein
MKKLIGLLILLSVFMVSCNCGESGVTYVQGTNIEHIFDYTNTDVLVTLIAKPRTEGYRYAYYLVDRNGLRLKFETKNDYGLKKGTVIKTTLDITHNGYFEIKEPVKQSKNQIKTEKGFLD